MRRRSRRARIPLNHRQDRQEIPTDQLAPLVLSTRTTGGKGPKPLRHNTPASIAPGACAAPKPSNPGAPGMERSGRDPDVLARTQPEIPQRSSAGSLRQRDVRPRPQGLRRAGDRSARIGQDNVVCRRGVTPLSSDCCAYSLDRCGRTALPGLVFSTLRSLLRARLIARCLGTTWTRPPVDSRARQWIKMARALDTRFKRIF